MSNYKQLTYFRGVTKSGRVVEGNLINDKFNAIICSGFYKDRDEEGDIIYIVDHPHEVLPETVDEISFQEYTRKEKG